MIRKSPAFRSKWLREPASAQTSASQMQEICNGNSEIASLYHLSSPMYGIKVKAVISVLYDWCAGSEKRFRCILYI